MSVPSFCLFLWPVSPPFGASGSTSRTRSHRSYLYVLFFAPPNFCGALQSIARRISAFPFPRRLASLSRIRSFGSLVYTNELDRFPPIRVHAPWGKNRSSWDSTPRRNSGSSKPTIHNFVCTSMIGVTSVRLRGYPLKRGDRLMFAVLREIDSVSPMREYPNVFPDVLTVRCTLPMCPNLTL